MRITTSSVVSADGTRIVFHCQGDGPPLLIVHGTLATTDMYRPIADRLSPTYQVVRVERRGYGISGAGHRPGTFARQAEDITAVLRALDGPGFVFGHSCGGVVALEATVRSAADIRGLALYEPPVALLAEKLVPVLHRCRELVDAGRRSEAVIHFLTVSTDAAPGLTEVFRPIAELLQHRADGMLVDLECVTGSSADLDRWLPIGTPTLLLTGSDSDSHSARSTALLQNLLTHAKTVSLPGQSHHPDDPDLVADTLRGFFDDLRAGRP